MTRIQGGQQERNRAQQEQLYGAPLSETFDRLTSAFGISRGALAGLLGLSAPMLSQLATAHRVKIGNPSAVHRLQRLLDLREEVRAGVLGRTEALHTLESEESGRVLTRTTELARRRAAGQVSALLRAVATPGEILDAAGELEGRHPRLAEILRVYGTGDAESAAEHFRRLMCE